MTGRVEQLDPEKTLSIKSKGDSDASLALVFLILIGLVQVGANEPLVLAQEKNMGVVFVLLSEPRLPKGEDVVRSFSAFATEGQGVQLVASKAGPQPDAEILEFELRPNGKGVCHAHACGCAEW